MSRTPAIANNQPAATKAPSKRRTPWLRWSFILLLVALGSLSIPQVFQTVVGWVIKEEVWRRGGQIRIDRIDGSLWEPVVLVRSFLSLETAVGGSTRVEIAKTEVNLAWKNLLERNGERVLQRVSLRGVQGKVQIPLDRVETAGRKAPLAFSLPLPAPTEPTLPSAIEAHDIDFIFQSGADFVRVEDAGFVASSTEAGELSIPKLTISQPWLNRSFRNVHGKSALQDGRIALADVQLEPGVTLRTLTTAAVPLARGDLDIDVDVAAFDGKLHADASTKPQGGGVVFEAAGTFEQINIAKLASFLALSDAAGGVIKDGKFTFRGPPRNLQKAQASLRFDAVNFQWETRQWDSLTLGLLLMDRRLQVPQLDLRQGKNELHLTGDLTFPTGDQKWWQGEFNTTVDAKIENLTELSALLLPEFKYAAGKATIEGSIRGHGEEFNGQLLVSGSKLTWRNAPIETLHAAVKLGGKEIQIANVELVSGDDYLRGRGLVKFAQPLVYWGELRVAVDDLARYAAFLQKPVLPDPLAGGAIIDWTGEGSREGHSGKFLARLRKVRSIGALSQLLHPLDADLEATYGADTMQFSRFRLSDDESTFTANVAVGGKAINFQQLNFAHRGTTQLEGNALLPLDVWQKWPNVALDQLLTDETVSRVHLTARQMDLSAISLLTGLKFPIAGLVEGNLAIDGPAKSLKLGGHVGLTGGRIPLGWSGETVEQVNAQFGFRDDTVLIEKLNGVHRYGDVAVGGEVQFSKVFDPFLQVTLKSGHADFPLLAGAVNLDSTVDVAITGPSSAAMVKGKAEPKNLALKQPLDLAQLWQSEALKTPPPFSFSAVPFAAWQFDIGLQNAAPIKTTTPASSATLDLRLVGTGAQPSLSGKATFTDVLPTGSPNPALRLETAAVEFLANRPATPNVDVKLAGRLEDHDFSSTVIGGLDQLKRTYMATEPLTNAEVEGLLTGKNPGTRPAFAFPLLTPPTPTAPAPATPAPAPAAKPAPAAPTPPAPAAEPKVEAPAK